LGKGGGRNLGDIFGGDYKMRRVGSLPWKNLSCHRGGGPLHRHNQDSGLKKVQPPEKTGGERKSLIKLEGYKKGCHAVLM